MLLCILMYIVPNHLLFQFHYRIKLTMGIVKTIETFSADETFALGEKIGKEACKGSVYTLIGDLGVGKTVRVQGAQKLLFRNVRNAAERQPRRSDRQTAMIHCALDRHGVDLRKERVDEIAPRSLQFCGGMEVS